MIVQACSTKVHAGVRRTPMRMESERRVDTHMRHVVRCKFVCPRRVPGTARARCGAHSSSRRLCRQSRQPLAPPIEYCEQWGVIRSIFRKLPSRIISDGAAKRASIEPASESSPFLIPANHPLVVALPNVGWEPAADAAIRRTNSNERFANTACSQTTRTVTEH